MGLLRAMPPGGRPVASWSTVAAPALVLGRSHADPPLDREAIAAAGARVVRRSSGGGPVLWDAGMLSLDIVLPRGHPLAPDDVVAAYRWLGEAFARALRTCGVEDAEVVSVERARRARDRRGAASGACYGGLSPYEVTAGGRKVVGLSQARRRPGALLQAGVLMDLDADLLGRMLAAGPDFGHDLRDVATGLHDIDAAIDAAAVVAAVDAELARAAGAAPREDVVTAAERAAIAAAAAEMSA
ncbi:MAG: biotin/lipoate A/B protein ligase family protein [Thermoleophilia bacterium]